MSLISLEAEARPNKNLSRMHRGIVVDDADPLELGRVKVVIEGLIESSCPPDILPWAYPGISTQYRADLGGFTPPPIGSSVYIQFAHANVYAPIYFGAAGDTSLAGAGSYGSNIRPYEGATYEGGGTATPIPGDMNEKAATIKQGLMDRGLSETAAEGVTLNLIDESGLDPGISEGALNVHGTRGFGLAQWTDTKPGVGRKTNLFNWAKANGKDPGDYNTQLDFLMYELNTPEYADALAGITNASTQGGAAVAFLRHFERPAARYVASRSQKYLNHPKTFKAGGASKEKQKYDANHANSRQGPTVAKDDHKEIASYGPNQLPVRQDGSKPEETVGTAFGVIDDSGTKAGIANYVSFDRKNNTLDVALASLGISIHADNQGRTWINMDNDLTMTLGGNVHKYIKGTEVAQIDGESFIRRNAAVTEYTKGNIAKTVEGNEIKNVSGNLMAVAESFEVQADAHRSSSGTAAARRARIDEARRINPLANANGGDLPAIDSGDGEEYREKKQKEHDEEKKVEHEKRQVYTDEVKRGHGLVAEAAGSSAITQAGTMLARVQELILSGANIRIPGGLMSMLPGQGGGGMGGLGGIMDLLGGDVMGKIMGYLPKELTGVLGLAGQLQGGNIQGILQPILGQALGKGLTQLQQMLPANLKNLPLALLNPGEIGQVLASLTNKDAIASVLTSAIKQQLGGMIPAELLKDDTVQKIVSTVIEANKLGSMPDGQSPASSLAQIVLPKVETDVLSYINNFTGLDTGYFYQIAAGLTTSKGSMKFPYPQDGVRAILAKVTELSKTGASTEDILAETYPTLTRAQIKTEAAKIDELAAEKAKSPYASTVAKPKAL